MNPFLDLKKYLGTFTGEGLNHEGEKFAGSMEIISLFGGKGLQIRFEATSLKDPHLIFHSEVSTLAQNARGGFSLFNFNSNTPFLAEHVLQESSENLNFVFHFGKTDDPNTFREEIRLELLSEGIGYHYSWGLPGGEFKYRSGVKMRVLKMALS